MRCEICRKSIRKGRESSTCSLDCQKELNKKIKFFHSIYMKTPKSHDFKHLFKKGAKKLCTWCGDTLLDQSGNTKFCSKHCQKYEKFLIDERKEHKEKGSILSEEKLLC